MPVYYSRNKNYSDWHGDGYSDNIADVFKRWLIDKLHILWMSYLEHSKFHIILLVSLVCFMIKRSRFKAVSYHTYFMFGNKLADHEC
jgi:hypothetical protein